MGYDRALRHTIFACCLETFRFTFAVTLPLVRSNSWDAQLAVPNEPSYARLVTKLGIWQVKEGRPGSIPLQSSFFVRSTTLNGGADWWASRAAHVMRATIPNVLQPGAFVWIEKEQGPLVKVLLVPGWQPMKQLAVRMHFLRFGGLLNDWFVEGVLSLVFV
ncbi:uncharacterized protein TNCV_3397011 [Trichonephila clavipes]|nr:uncharacterized protein TNCV_3397011 [Trichonephila clavipes]